MKKICVLFIAAVFALTLCSCGGEAPSGELLSYEGAAAAKRYGALVFVKSNENTGAVNYADERYSYWFDRDGYIMSSTLRAEGSGGAGGISAAEALAIAERELVYYAGADTSLPGWDAGISKSDADGYPWEVFFKYRDSQNVVTQNHSVVVAAGEDVLQMIFSKERKSENAVTVSGDEAAAAAVDAVFAYISESGISMTAEELASVSAAVITERELFALDGDTLWQVTLEGITAGGIEDKAYFVQLSATTGEVVYVEPCK